MRKKPTTSKNDQMNHEGAQIELNAPLNQWGKGLKIRISIFLSQPATLCGSAQELKSLVKNHFICVKQRPLTLVFQNCKLLCPESEYLQQNCKKNALSIANKYLGQTMDA